ncbi:MAG: GGDEF domain-containing protein [Deltaproteobacteria bacterium]|nr:GGDEF domain-containing protein [Deltaproteobacteria bacterium]
MATTDPLTGAANRRELFTALEGEVRRAQRHQRPLSLLMIDLDFFKRVNDAHGHDVGDKVLVTFVSICEREVRNADCVGRLGGEEFAIILPETEREAAVYVAERLRRVVARDPALPVPITISTGVAEFGQGESVASFCKRADDALYCAKGSGRDRVVCADVFVEDAAAGAVS